MTAPASATTARQAAYRIEALVARILVVGTYLAVGLILLGVLGMLAQGIDPLDFDAAQAFDLTARLHAIQQSRDGGLLGHRDLRKLPDADRLAACK